MKLAGGVAGRGYGRWPTLGRLLAIGLLGVLAPRPLFAQSTTSRSFSGPTAVEGTSSKPKQARETTSAPPPRVSRWSEHLQVAVGLGPEAAGSAGERAYLDRLQASIEGSDDPSTTVQRLRAGAGAPREVCRKGGYDLVIVVGYVADREEPVVLSHDCRLDVALGIRGVVAVDQPKLAATLWAEHDGWVRQGMKERRRLLLGPKARIGIVAAIGAVVLGGAIAALVVTRFREETVRLTVSPGG